MLDPRQSGTAGPVIVLGAGIAGLFAADRLSAAGHDVTVIERSDRCGGNHRSHAIGDYTFDVGSIFYEEGARIFDLAPHMRERCPQVLRIQRRIAPDGAVLHYPLEPREMLRPSQWRLPYALLDLALSRLAVRRDGTLGAISRQRLGRTFFETTGLEAYMTRFHHVPPGEVDEEFFFHRMGFIERATRLDALMRTALQSLTPRRSVPTQRRPLRVRPRSGFKEMFGPVAERLMSRGVRFHFLENLQNIRRIAGTYQVRTGNALHFADAVVSTIPLEAVHRAVFGENCSLVSLDMTTLFVSAEWLDPRCGNVLFNFHGRGRWKRATVYSRIYPQSADGREFLSVEATIAPGSSHNPRSTFRDFCTHMTSLGLARGLRLEGHERVADCYPLYSPGSKAEVQALLDKVSSTGIVLAGRQGRFEYLPTSSGVIRRVEEELNAAGILARKPELAA